MTSSPPSAPLSHRAHARALLVLGLPLIGSNLAMFAVGLTDTIMLGWYDVAALAAVVLGSSAFFMFVIFGSGFAWAVTPMVATYLSRDDPTQVRRVTRMGLWASGLFAALTIPIFVYSEPLLLLLGQEPEIARLGGDYLRIAGWGIIPALGVNVLKSFLAALERGRIVLIATLAGVLVNIVINYVLIFGHWGAPELGLRGAAIASLGVHSATYLVLMIYVRRVLPEYQLFIRFWRPDWEALVRVFRLGWPIGVTGLAEVALFSGAAVVVGWIGVNDLAAHGVALNLASMSFMVHLGLSTATTVYAGRAFGAEDVQTLRRVGVVATVLSVAVSLVTIVIWMAFPEALIGVFLEPEAKDRAEIVALGVGLLVVAALFQLVDGAQVIALGLLRGVQDTRVPMILAALSYWAIGMPAGYVLAFPMGLGAQGVWLGLCLGLAMAALFMMVRFWGGAGRGA